MKVFKLKRMARHLPLPSPLIILKRLINCFRYKKLKIRHLQKACPGKSLSLAVWTLQKCHQNRRSHGEKCLTSEVYRYLTIVIFVLQQ